MFFILECLKIIKQIEAQQKKPKGQGGKRGRSKKGVMVFKGPRNT